MSIITTLGSKRFATIVQGAESVSDWSFLHDSGYEWRILYHNGYTAKVAKNPDTAGYEDNLWQVELSRGETGRLVFGMRPIPEGYLMYLNDDEVVQVCGEIAAFPAYEVKREIELSPRVNFEVKFKDLLDGENSLFLVSHLYDADNGDGRPVPVYEPVALFEERSDAESFCRENSRPEFYDSYERLEKGRLRYWRVPYVPAECEVPEMVKCFSEKVVEW